MIAVRRNGWRFIVPVCLAVTSLQATAGDRPFLATSSAAAEEDDDGVWSVESWYQSVGAVRSLSVAPEYAFNPTTSVQFEFTRERDRDAAQTSYGAEIDFKHLFNHIGRDGYGWGVVATLALDKPQDGPWQRGGVGVNVPLSLVLADGAATLHLNLGVRKPRDAQREWTSAAAIEGEVAKRTTVFAEVAREGNARLVHGGVRWWVTKERLALDLGVQRTRADGVRDSGVVIGIGFYDL